MATLQDTLHADTVVWLESRNTYRDEYVSAWVGPAFYPVGPTVAGFPDQQDTPWQCEVTYNNGFTTIDPGFYVNKNSGSAVTAWPTADGVTKELIDGLSAAGQEPIVLEKAAKWQLQINGLEAFRRTLLNQRQRRKQLITAYRARWDMETQSQTELEAALQNAKLGQKAEPIA
jgi:hypothetical protein